MEVSLSEQRCTENLACAKLYARHIINWLTDLVASRHLPKQLPPSYVIHLYEHQALASPFFLLLLSAALKSDMLCVRAKTCINQQFQI